MRQTDETARDTEPITLRMLATDITLERWQWCELLESLKPTSSLANRIRTRVGTGPANRSSYGDADAYEQTVALEQREIRALAGAANLLSEAFSRQGDDIIVALALGGDGTVPALQSGTMKLETALVLAGWDL